MAYSSDDLATLQRAIASGINRVRYADGREVTYQSLDAMLRAEKSVAAELGAITGPSRRRFAAFRNGC